MSPRAKLTLSYTAVMTLLLIGFAALSYVLVANAVRRANNDSMRKTASAAKAALDDETRELNGNLTREAASEVLSGFRSADREVVLLRPVVATSGAIASRGVELRIGDIVVRQSPDTFLAELPRAMTMAVVIAILISALIAHILAGRAIGPIESAFASQRRFMADASHELRTPVTILQGEVGVALAKPERDPAEYRETLEVMQRAIRQLARVVRDLFLLSRADTDGVPLQKSRFYLEEAIASSLQSARTLAQSRGITLTQNVNGEMPVEADEDLIREMLMNLIDNAIKYSDGGEVVVSARRERDAYEIEVRDRGRGIAVDQQPLIFDRFHRIDHTTGGAGLGLPIARTIARAHGGDVVLRASSSSGSTFVCIITTGSSIK